jgi:hypothetical protein
MRCFSLVVAFLFPLLAHAHEDFSWARSGRILLVGDSHMAGTLGDALVPKLGGAAGARRYGIVGATAVDTYASNVPVLGICSQGCEEVCPSGSACPFQQGYRRADDARVETGRVPADFPRIQGLIQKERKGLEAVLVELGTNDAAHYACGEEAVRGMEQLLRQVVSGGLHCIYVGPPSYEDGPVIQSCGSKGRYGSFVQALLRTAEALGCKAVDSTAVRDARGGPVLCREGGVHCNSAQAELWAAYITKEIK